VGNQGAGPAGPSRTTVNFTTGNTVTSVTMNTPVIPVGSTLDVMAAIPAGCFRPDCAFQIVADSSAEVGESNEANNVADGLCRG
jgi:subtilase family serine protease